MSPFSLEIEDGEYPSCLLYSHFMSAVVLSNSSGQPFALSSSTSKDRVDEILHSATSFLCENNQFLLYNGRNNGNGR